VRFKIVCRANLRKAVNQDKRPADLSVVGHDNLPATAFSDPPLSTMELPIDETGVRLADMVLARLGGADPRDLAHLRAIEMVDRASVAPP